MFAIMPIESRERRLFHADISTEILNTVIRVYTVLLALEKRASA